MPQALAICLRWLLHTLYLVMGKCFYVNVAKPGETPEEEHIPHEVGLFLDEHGVSQGTQFLFRDVAPVGLLHFKAVLAEGIGADAATLPRFVSQAEQGHGVYPESIGAQPFLHHRLKFPVHVPEVLEDAVLHHADTEKGVAQLLGGDEILFPEDAVVVVGEPGGDLFQLPVYLACLGGLAFRLAVLPQVGSDEQIGSHCLIIPVNGDFHRDGGFPVPVSHCGSLDVERGRKRTSLCFHNSKIFVSKGSYLFLTKSYAKQGKAMKKKLLC